MPTNKLQKNEKNGVRIIFQINTSLRKIILTPFFKRGFTLLEVLLAFGIFAVVMTLVLITVAGSFKSLRQAEIILLKEQKQRLCLLRLSKEVSSYTRIVYPQMRFIGESQSFFLFTPRRTIW